MHTRERARAAAQRVRRYVPPRTAERTRQTGRARAGDSPRHRSRLSDDSEQRNRCHTADTAARAHMPLARRVDAHRRSAGGGQSADRRARARRRPDVALRAQVPRAEGHRRALRRLAPARPPRADTQRRRTGARHAQRYARGAADCRLRKGGGDSAARDEVGLCVRAVARALPRAAGAREDTARRRQRERGLALVRVRQHLVRLCRGRVADVEGVRVRGQFGERVHVCVARAVVRAEGNWSQRRARTHVAENRTV